ncbi:hypothetical protein ACQKJC_18945 [Priestia koreensis]|uniref:hypothetical protein n=1 Tax=Priestia koreensis TaxID=284581 RepID=UPI003D012CD1
MFVLGLRLPTIHPPPTHWASPLSFLEEGDFWWKSVKRVFYDIETELVHASTQQLPYLNLYTEMLQTGKTSTHDHQVLQGVNQQFHYKEDVIQFFSERYWPKVEKS